MDAFLGDLFSDVFLHVFLQIFGASRAPKPWIPYWSGSKNHTFARIRFFTVLASIWGSFRSRKRTTNPVLAHFGGPCSVRFATKLSMPFLNGLFTKRSHRAPQRGPPKCYTVAEALDSGDLVKRPILRKAQLNLEENCMSARQRKRGPLGKENY